MTIAKRTKPKSDDAGPAARRTAVAAYIAGQTPNAIAKQLKLSVSTVRAWTKPELVQRLARARRAT